MPYSLAFLDNYLETDLAIINPDTAFDVGAGKGKGAQLIHKANPLCVITGFEPFRSYLKGTPEEGFYHTLHYQTFESWLAENSDWQTDLVFFGDVMEHMRKSTGLDVIEQCRYRAKWLMIVTPEHYFQNSCYGNILEAHISSWGYPDFARFNVFRFVRYIGDGCDYTYILIKGLL